MGEYSKSKVSRSPKPRSERLREAGRVEVKTETVKEIIYQSSGSTPSPSPGGGSVTSVGISMPTGFSVSGSPITTSGTFQVAFSSDYSLPKTADTQKGVTAYGAMTDMATDIQQAKTDIEDLDSRVTYIEEHGGGGGSIVSWGDQATTSPTINLTVNGTTKTFVPSTGRPRPSSRRRDTTALTSGSRIWKAHPPERVEPRSGSATNTGKTENMTP